MGQFLVAAAVLTIAAASSAQAAPSILTYFDAGLTTGREVFPRGATIYARATGLIAGRSYRFRLLDTNGTQVQLTSCVTGVTSSTASYTIAPTDPLSTATEWQYSAIEWNNTTCTNPTLATDIQLVNVAAVETFADAALTTPKTVFAAGETVHLRVLGFQDLNNINITWVLPSATTACSNTAGGDRPNSTAAGTIPNGGSGQLEYPPGAVGDAWNLVANYNGGGPCPVLSGANTGQWQVLVEHFHADHSRERVQLNAFTVNASCGNGTLDGGESCDEGASNGTATSCCTAGCAYVTAGTTCRTSTGVCDPAETCTGAAGVCPADLLEPTSTVCRTDAGACDVAENCTGASASCPAEAFESPGTSCGDPSDTVCDDPDTCSGSGACQVNNASAATVCRADAGECDVQETCDGAGSCPADSFAPAETACGDPGSSICDNSDSCDGNGACGDNNEPGSTVCRTDAGECDVQETCDGNGSCPADSFEPAETDCGDPGSGSCDNADTCDGNGACVENNEPGSTVCRADAGACDVEETCDGNGSCPADSFEPAETACGDPSDTACDNADTCDGDGLCVTNNELGTTVCRADAGECDVEETCDGVGSCPADSSEPAATACGDPGSSICDNADTCDGSGACVENNEPGSTVCRADAGECDVEETCDGNGSCPADSFEPAETACGDPGSSVCDNADTCDGSGACVENNEPGVTVCRADAGDCDVAETCDGDGNCPVDAFETAETACGDSTDTLCDNPDSCDGDGACLDNNEPGTTECRADAGDCDVVETCDGTGSCPADAFEPAETACGDPTDTLCDNADTCDGDGECLDNNEPGTTECRADAGECDVVETCDGNGSCPADAFEPAETACGDPGSSICDNADTCDGDGACVENNEPGSTVCRADVGECDVEETCDGNGDCPTDSFEPAETACGDPGSSICDNADTCDGDGACVDNNEPGSTVCRADAGDCDLEETCDGNGSCAADSFEPAETACGDPSDTVCDNADTCDGDGTCVTNNEPDTTECRSDAGDCDVVENCDGAGSCPADAFEPAETACGDPTDTLCDNADACDGDGECVDNNEPGTTECRADAGECDVVENCDGAGSCPADSFEPAETACGDPTDTICDNADTCDGDGECVENNEPGTTVCRADAGDCDVVETCDGNGNCPADLFENEDTACGSSEDSTCDDPDTCDDGGTCLPNNEPDTTVCRSEAGSCDVVENCDGAGNCPADVLVDPAIECRLSTAICDAAESCDGSSSECPPDGAASSETVCRAATGVCDSVESCDGSTQVCPEDGRIEAGTQCRDSAGGCDLVESCDGSAVDCPADAVESGGVECRGTAGDCDVAETCDGSGAACPEDGFADSQLECRTSGGVCDSAENCTGSAAECPTDSFEPTTVVCRGAVATCDAAERCTGNQVDCPADLPATTGTPCSDGNACTAPDSCLAGSCLPGGPVSCDDASLCTVDTCDSELGCINAPDMRDPETCYNSAAGRLTISNKKLVRKYPLRWAWKNGEPLPPDVLGDPGTTSYALCIFDQSTAEPTLATSLSIPAGAPFWKASSGGKVRYGDRQGTYDGVRSFKGRIHSAPNRSKLVLKAKGSNLPLPDAFNDMQLFAEDPSVVAQFVNDAGACWNTEFAPEDSSTNTVEKYRAKFH